eukprot:2991591-Pyramimonas_sp.AAC.1
MDSGGEGRQIHQEPESAARAEDAPQVRICRIRPPPDSVARSLPGDPLGRGDPPRTSSHLPPCMGHKWGHLLHSAAETLRALGPPA